MAKNDTTPTATTTVNSSIVTAYQDITAQTLDLNGAGLDFLVLVGKLMDSNKVSGREFRASIEQAGINPLVSVKPSHAEVIQTACIILGTVGREGVTVAKLLSLATRVKRSGVEVESGDTFESLDDKTPSIKEISDSKKETAQEGEGVTVALPALDALLLNFVSDLKKITKKDLQGLEFGDISTPALHELKVIMGQLAQNKKAHAKK